MYVSRNKKYLEIFSALLFVFVIGVAPLYAEGYKVAPRPDWVKSITASDSYRFSEQNNSDGIAYLLVDHQWNLLNQKKERYSHYIEKALNTTGVSQISQLTINFDPSYETPIFHEIVIHRDGKITDRIKRSRINLIQREEELEFSIYDGSKTLTVFVEDVRVGDTIEYSYTLIGANPIFSGHFSTNFNLRWSVPVGRVHYRTLSPDDKPLYFKNYGTDIQPVLHSQKDSSEYIWEFDHVSEIVADDNLPDWYTPYPQIYLSDFENWHEVVNWAKPLYTTEGENLEQQVVIDSILATASQPEQIVLKALEFVQNDIRYLGIEMGTRSHKPNPPDNVIKQRFGDCKDKSRLLVSLLRQMGIKAAPALVNTTNGKGVQQGLPTPTAFNHVIVVVDFNKKRYWLDPTRNHQSGDLDYIYQPDYEYALIISDSTDDLVNMSDDITAVHSKTVKEEITVGESIDLPATYLINTSQERYYADSIREHLAEKNLNELEQSYLKYTAGYFPEVKIARGLTSFNDDKKNIITLVEEYTVPDIWDISKDERYVSLSFEPFLINDHIKNVDSPLRTMPYSVTHPVRYKHTTRVEGLIDPQIENEFEEVVDDAFRFTKRSGVTGNAVTIEYFYESLSDHVMPVNIKAYSANIQKVQDLLYYHITMPNPALHFGMYQFKSNDINWIIVLPIIVSFFCLIFLCYKYVYLYDPPCKLPDNTHPHLEGLSGWLVLPCLGLLFAPIKVFLESKESWYIFSAQQWSILHDQVGTGMMITIALEMIYNTAIIIFAITLLALFFNRRYTFPRFYIIYMVVNLAVLIADFGVISMLSGPDFEGRQDAIGLIIGQAIFTMVWSVYMLKSERVSATFTQNFKYSENSSIPTPANEDSSLAVRN